MWDLQPGAHVAVTTAGEPLLQEFTVVEAEEGMAEMWADVEVELVDFAFAMPDEVAAGPQIWQITNAGTQWHELVVVQLQEGMTPEDLLEMFASEEGPPAGEDAAAEGEEAAGPPGGEMPFEMVYGYVAISEGNRAWVEVDLPPGEYTVICFLPDLMGDMSPHAAHGMVRNLIVNE